MRYYRSSKSNCIHNCSHIKEEPVSGSEDYSFYGGTYAKEVIDFDPSEYQVTVNVDIDYSTGKLKVDSYSVSKGGEAADAIVFENHYAPQPLTVNAEYSYRVTKRR